ncbi:MAG: GNAT family N-acetyltransferase [Bdellovibrionales bacterium]|nr:GNAT family N-acetyltransferase [Bdellovibrionales bacterium]
MQKLLCDPVYRQNTSTIPYPYQLSDAKQWIEYNIHKDDKDPTKVWCVEKIDDSKVCGMVGVASYDKETNQAEIGYWVGKEYWGRGIANMALQALLSYLQKKFLINHFVACTFEHNKASERVLQKNGFIRGEKVIKCSANYPQGSVAFLWEKVE